MQQQPHHMTENLLNHPRTEAIRKMLTSSQTSTFVFLLSSYLSSCSHFLAVARIIIYYLARWSLLSSNTTQPMTDLHFLTHLSIMEHSLPSTRQKNFNEKKIFAS